MKVLNLQCGQRHSFEGWFASEEDFQSQLSRSLVACPLCADTSIVKLPSAPRLNLGATAAPSSSRETIPENQLVASGSEPTDALKPSTAAQAVFLKALREVLANTEDVGERFADEARSMHYGDSESRSIRGQASLQEAEDLADEGIDVLAFSLPAALKETLQ
ncbi:hypothetical protein HC248_02323 [Polaromonas vacuolata]|uniref:DUF1178 family protein n=1 Tax=Polaromonas vacuolata TaxID=37448 RepID=A0A6H2HAV2_9BURK|nr:DUF1178 family protein [Polaromonas vacuolata]QJC57012.1 hypothetical protein HC248_02323 [Polaromonas vacuolata]